MATNRRKTPPLASDINKRLRQGDYQRLGTSKVKMSNPFNTVGKRIGDKLVNPKKGSGAATKQQLMREYAMSRLATKQGAMKAKKRAK